MSARIKKEELTLKGELKIAADFLFGQIKNRHVIFFAIYFIIISVLELVAYSGISSLAVIVASRIWLAGGAICFITLLLLFANAVKSDIIQKSFVSLAGIAAVIIFLFWLCGKINYTDVSPDATQQAAAGLNSFLVKDFNYTRKAFLGYPNRQYILVAFPALLFGRSILTLQLGFAIPFIMGILSLYSGLREWLYRKGMNGNYAAIAIYAIFTFRFITEYYINFEQADLPVSLTMILIGLFLRLICRPDAVGIFSIAWIGSLCSNTYTPVLATLGLLFIFIILLAVMLLTTYRRLPFLLDNRRQTAIILMAADANIMIFLLATLLGKRADRVTTLREGVNYFTYSAQSIFDFLTDRNAVFMGFMGFVVIIYLIAALTLRLKRYDFLLALWALGVFAATSLLEGYTAYSKAWIMQRALIVIPVLVTGIFLTLCDFISKYKINLKSSILIVVIVALAVIGRYNFMQVNQSFTYFNSIQPMKYMLEDLEKTTEELEISHTDNFNFVIYTDSRLMQNPADYFKFLYPDATVYIGSFGSFPEGVDLTKTTIIYGDKDITGMTPSKVIQPVPYINKRYDEQGAWYKAYIWQ